MKRTCSNNDRSLVFLHFIDSKLPPDSARSVAGVTKTCSDSCGSEWPNVNSFLAVKHQRIIVRLSLCRNLILCCLKIVSAVMNNQLVRTTFGRNEHCHPSVRRTRFNYSFECFVRMPASFIFFLIVAATLFPVGSTSGSSGDFVDSEHLIWTTIGLTARSESVLFRYYFLTR